MRLRSDSDGGGVNVASIAADYWSIIAISVVGRPVDLRDMNMMPMGRAATSPPSTESTGLPIPDRLRTA